jgi:ABC-type amino acid transport system permease subunit
VQHFKQFDTCDSLDEVKCYQRKTVFELDLVAEIFLIEFCNFLILAVQSVSLTDQVTKAVLALQFVLGLCLIIHSIKNIGFLMVRSDVFLLFLGSTSCLFILFILSVSGDWVKEDTEEFRLILLFLANAFKVTVKVFYFSLAGICLQQARIILRYLFLFTF